MKTLWKNFIKEVTDGEKRFATEILTITENGDVEEQKVVKVGG